jgi:hypothetical protein
VALQNGFPNFVVACALVGIVVLLVVPLQKVVTPVILTAIGGALVGITFSWALLLVLALLALPVLVVPVSRARWVAPGRQRRAGSAIALAVGLSLLVAVWVVSAVPIMTQLTVGGGVTPPSVGLLLVVVLGSVALILVVFARAQRDPIKATGITALRTGALALVPIGGTCVAAGIAVLQLRATGGVGYYFWKFAIGLELACLVVIVVAAAALVTTRSPGTAPRLQPAVVAASSVVLALAASQAFGYVGPPLAGYGVSPEDPITKSRESALEKSVEPNQSGERLLAALHVQESHPNRRVVFLPYPLDARTDPILAGQWYAALTGTYTDQKGKVILAFKPLRSPRSAGERVTAILREDPNALVAVGPDVFKIVSEEVKPVFRRRIVRW